MPLNRSDSHSIHPNVVKAPSTTWSCSILLSSAGVHPVPGGALPSALSGNPKSSCRFSPIHSASFVGNHRRTGCAVLYVYSSHCGHATPWGSVTRGAGSRTNSILLGLRRLISRRTQPVEFREFACIQLKNQSTYNVHTMCIHCTYKLNLCFQCTYIVHHLFIHI